MKKIILLAVIICNVSLLNSQDIIYSQYYSSPLSLNPAMTGFSPGDLRGVLNYRNVNRGFIPYTTFSGSFDMKIMRSDMSPNVLAVGAIFTGENNDSKASGTNFALVSAAYHLSFGYDENHFVAFGLQTGTSQYYANTSGYTFPTQWDHSGTNGYNPSLSSNESFTGKEAIWLFDLNMGVMYYSHFDEETSVFIGGSFFHLTQPDFSLYGSSEKLDMRYNIHGGLKFPISQDLMLIPNIFYTKQGAVSTISEGASLEYALGELNSTLKLGTWYRHSDASLIFLAGIQVYDFQLGLSSDFLSPVQTQAASSGAWELSLIYSPVLKNSVQLEPNPAFRY